MTRGKGRVDPVDDLLAARRGNVGLVRGAVSGWWIVSLSVSSFSHYIPLYWGDDHNGWYNGFFGLTDCCGNSYWWDRALALAFFDPGQ